MNDSASDDSSRGTFIPILEGHPLHRRPEYELKTLEAPEFFGPVRSVNVFVGPNNAGKSRFMRGLHHAGKFVRGPGPFADWRKARGLVPTVGSRADTLLRIRGQGWPWFMPASEPTRDLAVGLDTFVRRACGYTKQKAPEDHGPDLTAHADGGQQERRDKRDSEASEPAGTPSRTR